ncbi:4a-hydroxytetrahydrobiopterin dehydratase [Amphritea japonica]|uniref:Putative pterin-4-alpha-carbinolamine dehydratase n=1 Tax=Amphritea japonica ATCC BAA-1530 TaxID=1278309 RepID=A0A7R6SRG0_9GAMM|nr:4a-hydroxytetrahydrobiopterin dehydratase [Amphritea japonica]BBB24750.1 4a-hydroxytetrahydrobiopterin dehydratase [Amphritea japonica ATCC BAA-1530]
MTEQSLTNRSCIPCDGGMTVLNHDEVMHLLSQLDSGWQLDARSRVISKDFRFKGFYRTMAFVNALAWIANNENHHPDFEVGYNYCRVRFSTHALDGLSENDFICAAKVDALNP